MSASVPEIRHADGASDRELAPAERGRLVELNQAAYAFYMSRRPTSWVPDYLTERGLTIPDAGYAPGGWSTTCDALRSEGFSDDELIAAGIAKLSSRETLIDVLRGRLVLPIRNLDGELVAFVGRVQSYRADGRAPKYLNTPNTSLYAKGAVLYGLYENREALQAGATAVLVEGPLDAHAVTESADGAAVGLGTLGTAFTAEHVAALGEVVDLRGHPVTYAADDDEAGARAAAKVWPTLCDHVSLGSVHVADLSGHDPASLKAERGAAALRSAVCEPSQRMVDVHLDAVLSRWDMDNTLQVPRALADAARGLGEHVLGSPDDALSTMRELAGRHPQIHPEMLSTALVEAASPAPEVEPDSSPDSGGGATVYEFPARTPAADDADKGGSGGGGTGGGDGGSSNDRPIIYVRDRFINDGNGLWSVKYNKSKGADEAAELLPVSVHCEARIVEVLPDQDQPELTHVDLVARRRGEEHRLPGVPRERWEDCEWVSELPWPIDPGKRTNLGQIRKGIFATSDAPLVHAYGALGWQQINNEWCYVHAGGAMGARGPVEGVRVNVLPQLRAFALPDAPSSIEGLRDAVLWSTAVLDAMPTRIAAPLLGSAYRAVLGDCVVTVMPVGPPGGGKTAAAAVAAQHFAPSARYNRLPGPGAGEDAATTGALEEVRYRAGHLLLPIDDLAPDRGVQRASQRAAAIARSQFNRLGKDRLNRKIGMRDTHPPRSLPLVTGEESTTVESAESRTVLLRVMRGDIDVRSVMPMLDQHGAPEARARLTAAMVRHYAAEMPLDEWVQSRVDELRHDLCDPDAPDPGLDTRRAESLAELAVGWQAMLDMATTRGAISSAERAELWERAWAGLLECKRHLMAGTASRTPADRVRELLNAALVRREVGLCARDGGIPAPPSRYGWETTHSGAAALEGESSRLMGTRIGWTDGEKVWLLPGAAYPALARQAASENEPLTWTKQGLGEALADAGAIRARMMKNNVRRSTASVRLEGGKKEVWEFDHAFLFPDTPDDDEDEPDNGGDTSPQAPPLPDATPAPAPAESPSDRAESAPQPQHNQRESSAATPEPDVAPVDATADVQQIADEGVEPRGHAATSATRRRARAAARFRAVAAICEPGAAWLARPGEEPEQIETPPADDLTELLDFMAELGLGHASGHGRRGAPPAVGQVWITPALRKALEWPASLDGPAAKRTGVVKRLKAAGWKIDGDQGEPDYWTYLSRPDGKRLHLVVPEWMYAESSLEEQSSEPKALARRLAWFADATSIAWRQSGALTGQHLIAVTRPARLKRGPQRLPLAAGRDREKAMMWKRKPLSDEAALGFAHLYDFNALYRGAAAGVPLAWGEYEHIDHPTLDMRHRPGYWRVRLPKWPERLLPDPFMVEYRGERDTVIVATPTIWTAVDVLGWTLDDFEIIEADLAVETLEGDWNGHTWRDCQVCGQEQCSKRIPAGEPGSKGYGRLLDKWANELRDAANAVVPLADPDSEQFDPDASAVYGALKECWSRTHGQIARDQHRPKKGQKRSKYVGWRPDDRHQWVAYARYAIYRHLQQAAEVHRYPLEVRTDGVIFASDEPDWHKAMPPGFESGRKSGQVWPPKTLSMNDYLAGEPFSKHSGVKSGD